MNISSVNGSAGYFGGFSKVENPSTVAQNLLQKALMAGKITQDQYTSATQALQQVAASVSGTSTSSGTTSTSNGTSVLDQISAILQKVGLQLPKGGHHHHHQATSIASAKTDPAQDPTLQSPSTAAAQDADGDGDGR